MLTGWLYLLGGILFLWQGADLLVKNSSRLAASFGIPKIIIGLTLVALGTSTPELVVSVLAALGGSADIGVGNVVGSNLFNTLVILGLAALFHTMPVNGRILKTDAPVMLFFTVMVVCLGWEGWFRRWEGAALLLCFAGYMGLLLQQNRSGKALKKEEIPGDAAERTTRKRLQYAALCAVGLVGLYLGGEGTVRGAVRIGQALGISEVVLGLTVVAGGTSLPELFTSVVAMLRKEADISLGNIVGSNIFNLGFVLSIVALIRPLPVSAQLLAYDFWVLLAITVLVVILIYWRKSVERLPGGVLLAAYVAYLAGMFLRIPR